MNMIPSTNPEKTFSPDALNALTDEELDSLPFGVVGLELNGRIARYNVAEARFARLDRGRVIGKSFFEEIARCTAVPAFKGNFDRLRDDPKAPPCQFSFVFAFRFGAQGVDIELGRATRGPLIYMTVNRRKFLPRQTGLSPTQEAVPLVDLEPEAEASGVSRDLAGRRKLEAESSMLVALLSTLRDTNPATVHRTLVEWGVAWGRVVVVDMEVDVIERLGSTMGELTMATAMDVVADRLLRQRLGRLAVDFGHAGRGAIVLSIQRSVFAELGGHAACGVPEGLFSVVLTHLAKRLVAVREVRCARLGAPSCDFVAVVPARVRALERVAQGLTTAPDAAIDAMIAEVHRGES